MNNLFRSCTVDFAIFNSRDNSLVVILRCASFFKIVTRLSDARTRNISFVSIIFSESIGSCI